MTTEGGKAQFSVFGSRLALPDEKDMRFFGQLRWFVELTEGESLLIESTEVFEYGPIEGDKRARRMTGSASVNGEGSYPFVLEAIDAGGPGADEADTVSLGVGADAEVDAATPSPAGDDFSYAVPATALTAGDLQLVEFGNEATGT